jgi:NarL family two-component system response regulator LiaR
MESGPARLPLRVVIVDDHQFFRRGLREVLEDEGVEIVGEAADGESALQIVAKMVPDVAIMDLNLPDMSGVDVTRRLAAEVPATRVLVLTISADEQDVTDAILAGACGYLLKEAAMGELVEGVRAAASGEAAITPRIASGLLRIVRDRLSESPADGREAALSERELEVLRLVADGRDNAEIAERLVISLPTVKHHISNILMKLQVENRIQAAVYAVRSRLV